MRGYRGVIIYSFIIYNKCKYEFWVNSNDNSRTYKLNNMNNMV